MSDLPLPAVNKLYDLREKQKAELLKLQQKHAEEINQLPEKHAEEIKQLQEQHKDDYDTLVFQAKTIFNQLQDKEYRPDYEQLFSQELTKLTNPSKKAVDFTLKKPTASETAEYKEWLASETARQDYYKNKKKECLKYVGDKCTEFGDALITGVQKGTNAVYMTAVEAQEAMNKNVSSENSYLQGKRNAQDKKAADEAADERQIILDDDNPEFYITVKNSSSGLEIKKKVRGYNIFDDVISDVKRDADFFQVNGITPKKQVTDFSGSPIEDLGIKEDSTIYLYKIKSGGKKRTKKRRKTITKRRKMAWRHKGTKRRV
jgi:hypothetical protein